MPFPFIAAAGLVVMVTASCAAWLLNEMTAEEKAAQGRERGRQDDLRKAYSRDVSKLNAQHVAKMRGYAETQLHTSLTLIDTHSAKERDITDGIAELLRVFRQEMAADSTSPSRKAVLRREYCRIEDASARLHAYRGYLASEREMLQSLFRDEKYGDLLDRDLPQPLLPVEWLYPGKLVLVGMHELAVSLKPFGHKLVFGRNERFREEQLALAVGCGDDIPVLVVGQHKENNRVFFGCVARGKLYCEHIRVGLSAPMEVVRSGKLIRCKMYNGLVEADLPKMNMAQPNLTFLPGQKVNVYPELFDLCLQRNPFIEKSRAIQVSEFPPVEMGALGQRDLYMEIEESLLSGIDDERFFSTDSSWTLLEHEPDSGLLVLGKGNVRAEAYADIDAGLLIVERVVQCVAPQIGFDTGFQLVLMPAHLNARELVGWKDGAGEFMRVALQMSLGKEHLQARAAQAEFMRRWQRVVDYQISLEHYSELKFSALVSRPVGRRRLELMVPAEKLEQRVGDGQSVKDLYAHVFSEKKYPISHPEKCFRLERWDNKTGRYLPAMSEVAAKRAQYCLEDAGLVISADLFTTEADDEERMFRFSVRVPSAPLDRQLTALDDFFNDRMVNPEIKDILLSPATYIPPVESPKKGKRKFFGKPNESQAAAVSLALSPTRFSLIQGPPGTGKTTVIVELIQQLKAENPNARILVVSQQNAAVDNALSRYVRVLNRTGVGSGGVVRIGPLDKVDAELAHFQIDNVLEGFKKSLRANGEQVRRGGNARNAELADQWLGYLSTVDNVNYGPHQEELFITLLSDKHLVGATCVGLASKKGGVDSLQFDIAIIDEAGRATVPELLIPIMRAHKVVLIGDHYQLPPSIAPLLREETAKEKMEFLREDFLESSFFERLYDALPANCKAVLKKQFRMPPDIGDLVADLFYSHDEHRLISNDDWVANRKDDIFTESLYWFNVRGEHAKAKDSNSLENSKEADAIANLLFWTAENYKARTDVEVAVITPYSAQKKRVRQLLSEKGVSKDSGIRIGPLFIRVDTVDAFQGSEADLVCYSPVRTSPPLDFVLDRKRLNVACSRARKHLIFFGHKEFLSSCVPSGDGQNLFAKIAQRASSKHIKIKGIAAA